jgi:LmbE family N-acetylglucosaminyl deacetylase
MHTEPAALFLFAHQDDEYGVFHRIEECVREGKRVHCAYFTDGASCTPSARRNHESLAVLAQLGVRSKDVAFAGEQVGLRDANLPEQLPSAYAWLSQWLDQFTRIDSIHIPAWEGAHQDHDALHALMVKAAQARGMLALLRQFPLYHGYRAIHPYVNALSPLAANGPVTTATIPWRARRRYLLLCLSYRSQKRTWAGLLPFVLWHYLLHGTQALQPACAARIEQQPHEGTLYYERRKFYSWDAMRNRIGELGTVVAGFARRD